MPTPKIAGLIIHNRIAHSHAAEVWHASQTDLDRQVAALVHQATGQARSNWQILHDHHCGGYARVSSRLKEFILAFERIHEITLDPVYTGKALYCVHQMLAAGLWQGPITFIHTGGLQGRRGFGW